MERDYAIRIGIRKKEKPLVLVGSLFDIKQRTAKTKGQTSNDYLGSRIFLILSKTSSK